jgi:hypothetical protein
MTCNGLLPNHDAVTLKNLNLTQIGLHRNDAKEVRRNVDFKLHDETESVCFSEHPFDFSSKKIVFIEKYC